MLNIYTTMNTNVLSLLLTVIAIVFQIIAAICAPLWLDILNPNSSSTNQSATSEFNRSHDVHIVDPFFCVLSQGLFPAAFSLAGLIFVLTVQPWRVTGRDRRYPKKQILLTGGLGAFSSLLINYALSGTRTAPYLQALLGNLMVPIQFLARLIILRRRPTFRKFLCAVVVMVAEFICLLPRIFPALASSSDRQHDGGATGTAGFLWPLAFVSGFIPGTIVNAFMERSVKDDRRGGMGTQQPPDDDLSQAETEASDTEGDKSELHATAAQPARLNMVYYLFWYYLFFSLTTLLLFWSDIIPHYGTAASMSIFGGRLWFNLACFFGQSGCGAQVVLLGWVTMFANFVYVIANANLLRYSEGANYLCIAMTLQSPILFLIWTLFSERRHMAWDPHASLSTWLSVGALCVMVPAVYIYNTGPPEKFVVLGAAGRRGAARTGPESSGLLDGNIQDTDDLN